MPKMQLTKGRVDEAINAHRALMCKHASNVGEALVFSTYLLYSYALQAELGKTGTAPEIMRSNVDAILKIAEKDKPSLTLKS